MVKTMFKGSTIEIWSEDQVNNNDIFGNYEILQIEYACEDKYMVEIREIKEG